MLADILSSIGKNYFSTVKVMKKFQKEAFTSLNREKEKCLYPKIKTIMEQKQNCRKY